MRPFLSHFFFLQNFLNTDPVFVIMSSGATTIQVFLILRDDA